MGQAVSKGVNACTQHGLKLDHLLGELTELLGLGLKYAQEVSADILHVPHGGILGCCRLADDRDCAGRLLRDGSHVLGCALHAHGDWFEIPHGIRDLGKGFGKDLVALGLKDKALAYILQESVHTVACLEIG